MKHNLSDMEINNNNLEDNCINVEEITRRIIVRMKPLVENYLLDLVSKDVEELNPEQKRDDVSEMKVTMNKPAEKEDLNPNSDQSRNVSLKKDLNHPEPELNPTVPLFTSQMLKRGRRNNILMKNGDNGVFEPEFVPMYEFDLVTMKFVRIRKKGENLFDGGLYKNDDTILAMFFYICSGYIWHPNAGVG